jgi:hypothetical protein
MSSGKKKIIEASLSGTFKQEAYDYHHLAPDCDGTWGLLHSFNTPYPMDGLGMVVMPMLSTIACSKCKAAYMLPGFLDFVEKSIAAELIVSDRILLPNEIRFLRLTFDLTQQQVVDAIDAESVAYYSKCETGKAGFALSADKQVRLKVYYATRLGIDRAEDYLKINLTSARRDSAGDVGLVVDLRKVMAKNRLGQLKELERRFKAKHKLKDLRPAKEA